jgi:glutaredoxin 1
MAANQHFIVFGKPECGYCVRAKRALDTQRCSYDFVDVREGGNREEMIAYLHRAGVAPVPATVPQVFRLARDGSGAEYIGGFDRLSAFLRWSGAR